MANFKDHIYIGSTISCVGCVIIYFKFGLSIVQSIATFILATLASIIPDIDHSESVPNHLLFNAISIIIPVSIIFSLPIDYINKFNIEHSIVFIFLSYILLRYSVAYIFNRFTSHRGIFHSIPASIVLGEIIFLCFYHLSIYKRIIIASTVTIGYLIHLIVDELWSLDEKGNSIKRSFGTALDFGKLSSLATWITYFIIFFLALIIWEQVNGTENIYIKQIFSYVLKNIKTVLNMTF